MPSATAASSGNNRDPFGDADAEWSDEEVLLPKVRRPVHRSEGVAVGTSVIKGGGDREREQWRSSSCSDIPIRAGHGNGNSTGLQQTPSFNGSPIVPPKSPSRPDVRPGSSQDDLVQRFYAVTKERDALRKELQRRSMGPNGLPARASVVYHSDEKALIESLFTLRSAIRNWSEEYFSGHLTSRYKRPHIYSAKELFGSLTNNHMAYIKHPEDRPLLVQAYIWSKLQQRIFSTLQSGCGYVWAGRLGDRKLRPLNDTLRKAVKNEAQAESYHRWRALTVNLLVPQEAGKLRPVFDVAPIFKRIQRFCSKIRRRLRPWSTSSLSAGKKELHDIVSAAVALDLTMKRQAADYRFVTFTGGRADQQYGYGFYDSEMDDLDEDEPGLGYRNKKGATVELSVAPALERCGSANGYQFESSFILVKADVSCRKPRQERDRRDDRKRSSHRKSSGMGSLMSAWKKR